VIAAPSYLYGQLESSQCHKYTSISLGDRSREQTGMPVDIPELRDGIDTPNNSG